MESQLVIGNKLARYGRLLALQLRISMTLGAQYRSDFLLEGLVGIVQVALAIIPLRVAFAGRASIAGWSFGESLVVMGGFTILQAVLWGAIHPSLVVVGEHIRKGTLDFILLKPADAQFLVSTSRFQIWQALPAAAGIGVVVYALAILGRRPAPLEILLALAVALAAALVLYSICILAVSIAFWIVRLDNLAYLLSAVFDASRWPIDVFRGAVRVLFTFVIPLALMTTYPAQALLGRLSMQTALAAGAGAALFAILARSLWKRALGHYTSASS